MKLTMIQKLLIGFLSLLLVSLVSVSSVYYSYYSSHVENLGHKNQETAFKLIFDSLRTTVADSTPTIDAFIRDSLERNFSLINTDQDGYDFHNMNEQRLFRELPAILSRYRELVSAIDQFASGHGINKLVIYDKERQARVVYLQEGEEKQLGLYLGTGRDARFIPYSTQQLSELGGQLFQFLTPEELWAMVRPSLPAGISSSYEHDLPNKTTVQIGHLGSLATTQFINPLLRNGTLAGLSEIEIGIHESDMVRFADYSHTEINIFADNQLSIGTLPKYHDFNSKDRPEINRLDFNDFRLPEIVYSKLAIEGEVYSQGRIAIGDDKDFIVLTTNYPQEIITRERNALLISISLVVVFVALLGFFASGIINVRINHFIQQLISYLERLAHGDVPEKMSGPIRGELGAIKDNFNALITNYGETVQIAGKIADGDLDVHLNERSEQDMLSRSLNTMTKNLKQARNTLEQRVAERTAQLTESDERYKLAESAANIGTWDWNIQSGALLWSEKIYTLFGHTPESFAATYDAFLAAVHPDDRQFVVDSVNAAVEEQKEYDIEHRVVWPDGNIRWVSETGEVFRDDSGQPIRMLGIVQDITERKEAEAVLHEAHTKLEAKVAERTSELSAANLKLQELDKLKSMFIASMSHELRTPLNSIIGFSGMLLQGLSGDLNHEQRDDLQRVYRAGNHLLDLISDVIDISKIEAGRVEVFPQPVELKAIVEDAIETIQPLADKKQLQLSVEADGWPQMVTDRKRLFQCLLNYLSNAVKFSEQGQIVLKVQDEGEWINLSVKDTGMGIAESDIPKLFEAFERLESHLRVKAGGSGLGLYLTKKIVDGLLGGGVYVESKLGVGSTFGLRIPKVINKPNGEKL